jgi:hypothetical protein
MKAYSCRLHKSTAQAVFVIYDEDLFFTIKEFRIVNVSDGSSQKNLLLRDIRAFEILLDMWSRFLFD